MNGRSASRTYISRTQIFPNATATTRTMITPTKLRPQWGKTESETGDKKSIAKKYWRGTRTILNRSIYQAMWITCPMPIDDDLWSQWTWGTFNNSCWFHFADSLIQIFIYNYIIATLRIQYPTAAHLIAIPIVSFFAACTPSLLGARRYFAYTVCKYVCKMTVNRSFLLDGSQFTLNQLSPFLISRIKECCYHDRSSPLHHHQQYMDKFWWLATCLH